MDYVMNRAISGLCKRIRMHAYSVVDASQSSRGVDDIGGAASHERKAQPHPEETGRVIDNAHHLCGGIVYSTPGDRWTCARCRRNATQELAVRA